MRICADYRDIITAFIVTGIDARWIDFILLPRKFQIINLALLQWDVGEVVEPGSVDTVSLKKQLQGLFRFYRYIAGYKPSLLR